MKKSIKIILISLSFILLSIIGAKSSEAASILWPIGGNNANETYIEYGYGPRSYSSSAYINKCKNDYGLTVSEGSHEKNESHYGVDIFGIPGHTYRVIAVTNGTVIATSNNYAGNISIHYPNRNQRRTSAGLRDGGGYGNFIVLQGDNGKCYLYAHLLSGTINVKKGDRVSQGTELATMGSSGDAGHMHLHFEVRKNASMTLTNPNGGSTRFAKTTGYNQQTEDPINYIGTNLKITNASYQVKNDTIETIFNFNQDFKINQYPTVNVSIGNISQKGNVINQNGKKLICSTKISALSKLNGGKIKFTLSGGSLRNTNSVVVNSVSVNQAELSSPCTSKTYTGRDISPISLKNVYSNITENRKGDVNGDGKCDSADASLILQLYAKYILGTHLSQKEQEEMRKGDVNGDGKCDSADATIILKYYANVIYENNSKNAWYNHASKCDVNGDGNININDYNELNNAVLNIMLGKQVYNSKYDINEDGKVDSSDVSMFLKVIENL